MANQQNGNGLAGNKLRQLLIAVLGWVLVFYLANFENNPDWPLGDIILYIIAAIIASFSAYYTVRFLLDWLSASDQTQTAPEEEDDVSEEEEEEEDEEDDDDFEDEEDEDTEEGEIDEQEEDLNEESDEESVENAVDEDDTTEVEDEEDDDESEESESQESQRQQNLVDAVINDQLTKIEGIGPKIEEMLNEAGISTFAKLASSNTDKLKEILSIGGERFKMHNPMTWPEQADLAASGKWAELEELQDRLDGGKL